LGNVVELLPEVMEKSFYLCLAFCKDGVRLATLAQARMLGIEETANELYGLGVLPHVNCPSFHTNMLTYIARSMVIDLNNYRTFAQYDHQIDYIKCTV
jgi:hypothetical protein